MPKLSDLMEKAGQCGKGMIVKEARECMAREEFFDILNFHSALLEMAKRFLREHGS